MSDEVTAFDFGDAEPEDAWHPDDPLGVLVDNVDRRCTILGEPRRLRGDATIGEILDEIGERLHRLRARRRDLSERDEVRVGLIADDLTFLRARLRDEVGQ